MGTVNKDELWAELDELGEEGVREKYDLGLYAGRKKDHVEAWFNKQDRHRRAYTPWHKMLSGKIVVAYLAEHSWNPSLDVLEKIGCFVRTEDELERVLCVVLENGKEIKEIRRREQEFLAKYIEEPGADPWARAEELLAKVLQRVQTEQMCN